MGRGALRSFGYIIICVHLQSNSHCLSLHNRYDAPSSKVMVPNKTPYMNLYKSSDILYTVNTSDV